MGTNIDKYTAIRRLEEHYHQIEKLKLLNHNNNDFKNWEKTLTNLLEDIFSKENRQYKEFTRISFHREITFLSDPENEKYLQEDYSKGLQSAQNYLTKLISHLRDIWNISLDYENIKAIQPNIQNDDYEKLAKSIRENLENNEPEIALDRLHTFLFKYFRQLSTKHGIIFTKKTPLHSLFGSYVKYLTNEKKLESEISITILKYSISILDKYNDIRNNMSFAHDNKILGYHESKLIFNNISNLIQYINIIENK